MLPRARTLKSPIRAAKRGNKLFAWVCRSSWRQALNTITIADLWYKLTIFAARYFVTKLASG